MNGSELKQYSDRRGIIEALQTVKKESIVELPLDQEFIEEAIEELTLSVRASNALRRAKIRTVRQVCETIMSEEGLEHIRNLGKTSIYEIKTTVLQAGYERLSEEQKTRFWENVQERSAG